MSRPETEANKEIVALFIDEVFERVRPEAVDELVADGFISHSYASPTGDGKADLKAATKRMRETLKDIKFREEQMIAEGDIVAVRLTARATPVAPFMGVPPAGRGYEIGEMHFFRLQGGRITEHWHEFDSATLLRQLRDGDGDELSGEGSPRA